MTASAIVPRSKARRFRSLDNFDREGGEYGESSRLSDRSPIQSRCKRFAAKRKLKPPRTRDRWCRGDCDRGADDLVCNRLRVRLFFGGTERCEPDNRFIPDNPNNAVE